MTTTYKATWGAVFRSLAWLVLFCLPAVTVIVLLLLMPIPLTGGFFFLVGIPIFLIGAGLALCLFLFVTVMSHRITISPEGISYYRWPMKTIHGTWAEVEKITKGRFLNRGKTTLLVRRKEAGYEFKMGPITLGSADFDRIPLSDFSGWKDGRMSAEISTTAPHLFPELPLKMSRKARLPDRS
jgi:hypothetical protein